MMIVTATVILDMKGHMLLGRRIDSGLYGPPGGKLNKDEQLKTGCARELLEETGIRVQEHDLIELGFCERTDKHQIIFWYWASLYRGSPRNVEPDKCTGWDMIRIPADEVCIPGLQLFKRKLLTRLEMFSGIEPRVA